MPQTKVQRFVFTMMMVFFMVYSMTCYTIAIKQGGAFHQVFILALQEMWLEYAVVFLLIYFVISTAAQKAALKITGGGTKNAKLTVFMIQSCTVCGIVPAITLFATLAHGGVSDTWFAQWVQTALLCFPAAYCIQICLAGPLVRTMFQAIFSGQLKN